MLADALSHIDLPDMPNGSAIPATAIPPSAEAYVPISFLSLPTSNFAPSTKINEEKPDLVNWQLRISQILNEQAKDPGFFTRMENELPEWADNVSSLDSPGIVKARCHIQLHWTYMLEHLHPNWPNMCYWDVGVVYQFSQLFLAFMVGFALYSHHFLLIPSQVQTTSPCPGHTSIKARTLASWMSIVIHLIVTLTRDPATNNKCGLLLLMQHNLHNTLKQQVLHHASRFHVIFILLTFL